MIITIIIIIIIIDENPHLFPSLAIICVIVRHLVERKS